MSDGLWAALHRVLAAEQLPFDEASGARALRIPFEGAHGRWLVFARDDDGALLRFYALCPVGADGDGPRAALLELVARINYGLPLATFELDVDRGELRVRTGVDAEPLAHASAEVIDAHVSASLYACAAALDLYLPAILRVLEHGEAPREALARAEADAHQAR